MFTRACAEKLTISVLAILVTIALWTVVRDWSYLLGVGGWFALLGRFLAVLATLVVFVVLFVLGCSILALPVLVYFAVADPASHQTLRPERALRSGVYSVVNPLWKACWWAWWLVFRRR